MLRTPVLASVGAAQAVALPIVGFSTAGYVLYGSVDFALGTAAGLVGAVGVVVGARIAHAAPAAALRRVVATALLCVGLLIAARTAWGATGWPAGEGMSSCWRCGTLLFSPRPKPCWGGSTWTSGARCACPGERSWR